MLKLQGPVKPAQHAQTLATRPPRSYSPKDLPSTSTRQRSPAIPPHPRPAGHACPIRTSRLANSRLQASREPGSVARGGTLAEQTRGGGNDSQLNGGGGSEISPEGTSNRLALDMDIFEQDKEFSRRYRRTVFDFSRWRAHRSAQRYVRHIQGLIGSRIVRGLSGPLTYTLVISTLLSIYETALASHALPEGFTSLSVTTSEPFNLSSFALSLLLVFRTNSSYSRWLDARKIWGGVVNRSRDLVRQGVTWFQPDEDSALLELLRRWTVAYSRSLQAHLREEGDLEADLKGVLPADELAALMAAQHKPNYVLGMLSATIGASTIMEPGRVRMDENLTFFEDALGACERILKTPIPLTYTRHTSRFLVIYVTFMPFTLWRACGWGCVPASVIIAFLLLGIEEIGVQIEEPFGILPLENICDTIERDCEAAVASRFEMTTLVDSLRGRSDGHTRSVPEQFLLASQSSSNGSIEPTGRGTSRGRNFEPPITRDDDLAFPS